MRKSLPFLLILFAFLAQAGGDPLRTAEFVDVKCYVGKWYTISALPQFFTRNCNGQTAEYEIINDESISVLNTCLKKKGNSTIKGKAVVKNKKTNAELIVTFDSFFTRLFRVKGDYTIIRLDEDYRYALVGSKDRKSLWILSRQPFMPEDVIQDYETTASEEGFEVSRLQRYEY
jgi:apolipoprotein D and lipocalin family protein